MKKKWLAPDGLAHRDVDDLINVFNADKTPAELTPNLRALRLAMTTSDLLLSMGVAANNVVSRALDITERYCDHPVNVTISYNLLYISQIRGVAEEPLTLIRPVASRDVNNMSIHAAQKLVDAIRDDKLSLDEAENRLEKILNYPANYPTWLPSLATAAVAPAVVLMYSTDWRIVLLTAIAALFVNGIIMSLSRRLILPFFRQAIASAFVTLFAAVITMLATMDIPFFVGIRPTLIVVGGIFLLISGLAIVGAVQDAFEEYYLTAVARIMRVTLLTMGIVGGILVGVYLARRLGMGVTVSPDPLGLTALPFQILGGGLAASAQALAMQTRIKAVIWSGVVGGSSVAIMYAATSFDVSIVAASGVAALYVGIVASIFARRWGTPASGIVASGILPLVPGLTLFTGLMQLVSYPPGNALFMNGVSTMFATIGAALVIATGASLGTLLGQPLQSSTQARNNAPFVEYAKRQLRLSRRITRLGTLLSKRRIDKNNRKMI